MSATQGSWRVGLMKSATGMLASGLIAAATAGDDFPELDVGYAPTPEAAIAHMFEMADLMPDDVLVDLGSGDGRIPIAAVRDRDVRRAIGIELDPWWPPLARERAREAGVSDRAEFIEGDIFEQDFYHASVVTMYLLPELNLRLRPMLLERMAPGSRIISHTFDMSDWVPDEYARVQRRDLYMWVIPARIAGRWLLEGVADEPIELELVQNFQHFEGAGSPTASEPVLAGRLEGRAVQFHLNGRAFSGVVDEGGVMRGVGEPEWSARRVVD